MHWLGPALVLLAFGCGPDASEADGPDADGPGADGPATEARVEVVARHPHDPEAFTQGLLFYQGRLYESTGQRGASTLREIDPETGRVLRKVDLPHELFGEGLARVGPRLIQLSYQAGRARFYELGSFALLEEKTYTGEGWGLCHDGRRLVMSDGSSTLTFRDPRSFKIRGTIEVRLDGKKVRNLNELECDADHIFANVWKTEQILEIDPTHGRVRRRIDASGLLSPDERRGTDVLNGIAWDRESDRFFITGKLWPALFEVRFLDD